LGDGVTVLEHLPGHGYNYIINVIWGCDLLTFKVTTVGSSAGFILNKEAMAHLKIQKGDTVYLTEAPDGGYRLTPFDPEFERQMNLADQIMHQDRNILKVLAK
jgi:putative addiction module antidote